MNGERYRGASLRSGLSMRHEGKRPAGASSAGAGIGNQPQVAERMAMGIIFEHDRRNFSGATGGVSLDYTAHSCRKTHFWQNEAKIINVFRAGPGKTIASAKLERS